jgi:DNA-binding transcriptional regulator YiaG
MVALPFYPYRTVLKKPHTTSYVHTPQTLGEHIKKKRIENDQLQKDVAPLLGISEAALIDWEHNHSQPRVGYYPKIIAYLGYYPFEHDMSTISGHIIKMRYCNGWSRGHLAVLVGVDTTAVLGWETTARAISPKNLLVLNKLLHQFLDTQHRFE